MQCATNLHEERKAMKERHMIAGVGVYHAWSMVCEGRWRGEESRKRKKKGGCCRRAHCSTRLSMSTLLHKTPRAGDCKVRLTTETKSN